MIKLHFKRINSTFTFVEDKSKMCDDMHSWYILELGKKIVFMDWVFLTPSPKLGYLVGKTIKSYNEGIVVMEKVEYCYKCGQKIELEIEDTGIRKRLLKGKKRAPSVKQEILSSLGKK